MKKAEKVEFWGYFSDALDLLQDLVSTNKHMLLSFYIYLGTQKGKVENKKWKKPTLSATTFELLSESYSLTFYRFVQTYFIELLQL